MGALELKRAFFLGLALTSACGASRSSAESPSPLGALSTPATPESRGEAQPSASSLPVDADDGIWGDANAPVVHNLRTAVIDAQGRLVTAHSGSVWSPAELVADLKTASTAQR